MPRINRAADKLAQGQPIFFTGITDLSFESGMAQASTWADYLCIDLEHLPFDMTALRTFMRGLIAGGPTHDGFGTPTVILTLPMDGTDEVAVRHNSWMIKQALAAGVHGLMLCHVESASAVRAFVDASRYAHRALADGHGDGRRGAGGQDQAAGLWGVSVSDYLDIADPWPLNPAGELLLGVKIENRRALENCEASLAVPGIALAEWGPGDMGMCFGHKLAHDPPYPAEMHAARDRVKAACDTNGVAFLEIVQPDSVVRQLEDGVRIGAACEESAKIGREFWQGRDR